MQLKDYHLGEEFPQFCGAIAPGRHCPLFGVCSVLRYVSNISVIYLGTNDCVYFAQKQYRSGDADNPAKARVISAELNDSDLIFGISSQLQKLVTAEWEENRPTAIYIVTSCSIEVISEDIGGTVRLLNRQLPCKVQLIRTENFKTLSYLRGIELTLEALVTGAEVLPKQAKTFLLLGARYGGAEGCEPARILQNHGYTLAGNLPYHCTEEDIRRISQAELSIVVDGTGVETARRLKADFGIEYYLFDSRFDLEKIQKNYQALSRQTGIPLSEFEGNHRETIGELKALAREKLKGITFFYGNVVLYPFESVLFLTELGMVPRCVFVGTAQDHEDTYLERLKQLADPEIMANANTAGVVDRLDRYRPDVFVGGTVSPRELISRNIRQTGLPVAPVDCGYSYIEKAIRKLLELAQEGTP